MKLKVNNGFSLDPVEGETVWLGVWTQQEDKVVRFKKGERKRERKKK